MGELGDSAKAISLISRGLVDGPRLVGNDSTLMDGAGDSEESWWFSITTNDETRLVADDSSFNKEAEPVKEEDILGYE